MTTPTTTQSPAELFNSFATQLANMKQTLLDLRAEEKIPLSDSLMLMQYHLDAARKKALLAAEAAAMVPEKTMSAGGENQQ